MKIKKINSFCIINTIKEHKDIKEKLLSLIDKTPYTKLNNISKSDFSIPGNIHRPYSDLFLPIVNNYLNKIKNKFKWKSLDIHTYWFQQYYEKDKHNWHCHGPTNFTNIYFLELPDKKLTTEIYDYTTNKKIPNLYVKEGDLLTFPSIFPHRSTINNTNKRKTIISFNTNFNYN